MLPADGPTRVWLSAWMSRPAERMALMPRITNAMVRPMARYRYMSGRWTPPRFMPAISAATARAPVIMLRRKLGRRTGGRPFSVVARGSLTRRPPAIVHSSTVLARSMHFLFAQTHMRPTKHSAFSQGPRSSVARCPARRSRAYDAPLAHGTFLRDRRFRSAWWWFVTRGNGGQGPG